MNSSHQETTDPAVRVEEFTFQYDTADTPALESVSFSVDRGDVLGVVGPVEAGKTSLSMALSGFVPQITGGWSEGDLSVAGRDPRTTDGADVAMVFEEYGAQLTQLRVIDEVVAPLVNRGLSRETATARARELLDRVRLDEPEDKFTWELSGGQQQRLAIAAVLATDPDVLVFDSATDMLDPEGKSEVSNLIASLAGETTLVVTENDPDVLVGIADNLLVLDAGEQVAHGPADDLLRDGELLDGVGVGPPVCLDVARRIGLDAAPITVGEFYDAYEDATDRQTAAAAPDGGATGPVAARAPSESAGPPVGVDDADIDAGSRFGDPVVDVDGVRFSYSDGTTAVEGVDMTVHEGEVHAVVGGNGAGKSTLSKLLVGVVEPESGRVVVDGQDTTETTARALGESIGVSLQNPDEQISRDTVDEELRFPLEQRRYERRGPFGLFGTRERYDESFVDERVEAVRELVGVDGVGDHDPAFLPLGVRGLVTIGSALASDPAAIVLDEPAAGVDASTRRSVVETIERLREDGLAVVLVDHDMELVCDVADRVTVLEDGTVAMQGPPREVFAHDNWEWLARRYLRPPTVARLARRVRVDALTADDAVDALTDRPEMTR